MCINVGGCALGLLSVSLYGTSACVGEEKYSLRREGAEG